jgi:diguanylate cyclase (GGDEF)-like protein
VITGIDIPLELALLLALAGIAVGALGGRRNAAPSPRPSADPLAALMRPAALGQAVDLAARRDAVRRQSHAVLRGRIGPLARLRAMWDPDDREDALDHVAAVMRAGLRRDDSIARLDGDGFTIIIPGADERAATRVAARLRRSLERLQIVLPGGEARLFASFGVAGDRSEISGDVLVRRAQQALEAAMRRGEDHIVAASEIEEVIYLPAPAPSGRAQGSASAA